MQRQSLGSPGSKLRIQELPGDDVVVKADDQSRRVSSASSSSLGTVAIDDDEVKLEKPHRPPSHIKPEKFIHFIPILTLLCFFILYLSSHEPSQNDLANFNGFRRPSELIDSTVNVDDSVRFVNRGEIFAIRSLRNLQETGKDSSKSRSSSHRKLGDF